MNKLIGWLKGKKTYFTALVMVIYAGTGLYTHALDVNAALLIIFNAAGIAGLRNGISTASLSQVSSIIGILKNGTTPLPPPSVS